MELYTNQYLWNIKGDINLTADPDKLWKIISAPNSLELFHPFCKSNKTINWDGVKSVDQIIYYNDLLYQRDFINWYEGEGYDLLIGEPGGDKSFVSWRIIKTQESSLSITIYPYKFNKGSKLKNYIPFNVIVKPLLQKYVDSVLLGINYYIQNNQKVKKNQFGKIRFFSN